VTKKVVGVFAFRAASEAVKEQEGMTQDTAGSLAFFVWWQGSSSARIEATLHDRPQDRSKLSFMNKSTEGSFHHPLWLDESERASLV
jgi:hypothetical protein